MVSEVWSHTARKELQAERVGVFKTMVLRKTFGRTRDQEKYWRKLYDEFHDLSSSLNIIRLTKSGMRWAGHVARRGLGFSG